MKTMHRLRMFLFTTLLIATVQVYGQARPKVHSREKSEGVPYSLDLVVSNLQAVSFDVNPSSSAAYKVRVNQIVDRKGHDQGKVAVPDTILRCAIEKTLYGKTRAEFYLLYLGYDPSYPAHGLKPDPSPWYWVVPKVGGEFVVALRHLRIQPGYQPNKPARAYKVFPLTYRGISISDTLSELHQLLAYGAKRGGMAQSVEIMDNCGTEAEKESVSQKTRTFIANSVTSQNMLVREIGLQSVEGVLSWMKSSNTDHPSPCLINGCVKLILGREDQFAPASVSRFLTRRILPSLKVTRPIPDSKSMVSIARAIEESGGSANRAKLSVLSELESIANAQGLKSAIKPIQAARVKRAKLSTDAK